jgi:hypothetical protein
MVLSTTVVNEDYVSIIKEEALYLTGINIKLGLEVLGAN